MSPSTTCYCDLACYELLDCCEDVVETCSRNLFDTVIKVNREKLYSLFNFIITIFTPWKILQCKNLPLAKVCNTYFPLYFSTAAILAHPVDLQLNVDTNTGSNVTFTVNADGSELTYQWQKDGNNIFDTANTYSGTMSATLTILSVTTDDSGQYRVIVSSPYGSVLSNQASLTYGK